MLCCYVVADAEGSLSSIRWMDSLSFDALYIGFPFPPSKEVGRPPNRRQKLVYRRIDWIYANVVKFGKGISAIIFQGVVFTGVNRVEMMIAIAAIV